MKTDLTVVRERAEEVASEKGIEAVVLFGSRARGEERYDSDWNLALIVKDRSGTWGKMKILLQEEKRSGRNIKWETGIEISYLGKIARRGTLAGAVVQEGIVIAGNKQALEQVTIGPPEVDDYKKLWEAAAGNINAIWSNMDAKTQLIWKKYSIRQEPSKGNKETSVRRHGIWNSLIVPWHEHRNSQSGLIASIQIAHIGLMTEGEKKAGNRRIQDEILKRHKESPHEDLERLSRTLEKARYLEAWKIPKRIGDRKEIWQAKAVDTVHAMAGVIEGIQEGTGAWGHVQPRAKVAMEGLKKTRQTMRLLRGNLNSKRTGRLQSEARDAAERLEQWI